MNKALIFEFIVDQTNLLGDGDIPMPEKILKITVKALPTSNNNVYVGWGSKPGGSNILTPNDSVTYFDERVYLDGNKLYVNFDSVGTGGKALVSIITDTGTPLNC